MSDDPDPIPSGATGTVRSVVQFENTFHLNIQWDEWVGRSLNLNCPPDEIEVIG